METTPNLGLPYLAAAQAQKHVTHNEAIRMLDALLHPGIVSQTRSDPPQEPVDGERYLVAAGGTGAWSGMDGRLAAFQDGAWAFYDPKPGFIAVDLAAGQAIFFTGLAWEALGALDQVPLLGIQATADSTNRLSVKSDATLFSHDDVTPGSGDMRQVLNKAAVGNTVSQLYQSNWSGRAETGLTGDDDFHVKVSPDGSTWHEALVVDRNTGTVSFPNTDLGSGGGGSPPAGGGDGPLINTDYSAAKGVDLFVNGTGLLGNGYNMSSLFTFDPAITPNLPGSFRFDGYGGAFCISEEFLPVDPNLVYRISSYLRQEGLTGDWSAYSFQERHKHYMGLYCYDIDKNQIIPDSYMRHKPGGQESLTTLAAPLTPGDTTITVADASNWDNTNTASWARGPVIFEYKNSYGFKYDFYSRYWERALWDVGGVNASTGVVTLNKPLPTSLANPDDANGTWPVGTKIACKSASGYKYSGYNGLIVPETDKWYRVTNFMGGFDTSGGNEVSNFAPGTAFVKLFWLPNYNNRAGGSGTWPDTGPDHSFWAAGVSLTPEPLAVPVVEASGVTTLKVPQVNLSTGLIDIVTGGSEIVEEVL